MFLRLQLCAKVAPIIHCLHLFLMCSWSLHLKTSSSRGNVRLGHSCLSWLFSRVLLGWPFLCFMIHYTQSILHPRVILGLEISVFSHRACRSGGCWCQQMQRRWTVSEFSLGWANPSVWSVSWLWPSSTFDREPRRFPSWSLEHCGRVLVHLSGFGKLFSPILQ